MASAVASVPASSVSAPVDVAIQTFKIREALYTALKNMDLVQPLLSTYPIDASRCAQLKTAIPIILSGIEDGLFSYLKFLPIPAGLTPPSNTVLELKSNGVVKKVGSCEVPVDKALYVTSLIQALEEMLYRDRNGQRLFSRGTELDNPAFTELEQRARELRNTLKDKRDSSEPNLLTKCVYRYTFKFIDRLTDLIVIRYNELSIADPLSRTMSKIMVAVNMILAQPRIDRMQKEIEEISKLPNESKLKNLRGNVKRIGELFLLPEELKAGRKDQELVEFLPDTLDKLRDIETALIQLDRLFDQLSETHRVTVNEGEKFFSMIDSDRFSIASLARSIYLEGLRLLFKQASCKMETFLDLNPNEMTDEWTPRDQIVKKVPEMSEYLSASTLLVEKLKISIQLLNKYKVNYYTLSIFFKKFISQSELTLHVQKQRNLSPEISHIYGIFVQLMKDYDEEHNTILANSNRCTHRFYECNLGTLPFPWQVSDPWTAGLMRFCNQNGF